MTLSAAMNTPILALGAPVLEFLLGTHLRVALLGHGCLCICTFLDFIKCLLSLCIHALISPVSG